MNCSPEEQKIRNSCINKRLPVYAFEFNDREKADCFIHILEREHVPQADMRYTFRTVGGKVMMFDGVNMETSGPFLLPNPHIILVKNQPSKRMMDIIHKVRKTECNYNDMNRGGSELWLLDM